MNPTLAYERAVLSGGMADAPTADHVCAVLSPQDFLAPAHRQAFAALMALSVKRRAIDQHSVAALAAGLGVPVEVTYDIAGEAVSPSYAQRAAKFVLAASQLREMHAALSDAAGDVKARAAEPESVEEMLGIVRSRLDEIEQRAPGGGPIHAHDAEPDLMRRILEDTPTPRGVQTGFYDVDKKLGGLRDGEMIVLAARPSVGKSLFAANIAENIAARDSDDQRAVLIFTMEMGADALYRRMLFGRAGIDPRNALAGNASTVEKAALRVADDEIKHMRLFLHAEAAITAPRMHSIARRFQAKHGACVVIVDYLGLMKGEGRGIYEQVTGLSKSMKSIAQDLNVPMVVLCQLNRNAAEDRTKPGEVKIPTLADLRDSGAIEQDADVVLFLARDVMQNKPHDTDLVLAKNRPGQTGKTTILFDTAGPRFKNKARVENFDGRS